MPPPVRHLIGRTEFRGDLPFHIKTSYHDKTHALWHDHDFWELAIIVAGGGTHHTSDEDRPIAPGDVYLVPPGVPHEYRVVGLLELVNVMVQEAFLDMAFPSGRGRAPLARYFQAGRNRIKAFSFPPPQAQVLIELAHRMEREFRQRDAEYRGIVAAQFAELCFRIQRGDRSQSHPSTENALPAIPLGPIAVVASYIQDHHAGEVSLAHMAALVGWSPAYLSRVFKAQTGETLIEYLNHVRIRKACELMSGSDRSLLEISMAVGYNSVSFFNRCFRKISGKSPGQFRESLSRKSPP